MADKKIVFQFVGGKRGRTSMPKEKFLQCFYNFAVGVGGNITSDTLKSEGRKYGVSYARIANIVGGKGKGSFQRGITACMAEATKMQDAGVKASGPLPEGQWLSVRDAD